MSERSTQRQSRRWSSRWWTRVGCSAQRRSVRPSSSLHAATHSNERESTAPRVLCATLTLIALASTPLLPSARSLHSTSIHPLSMLLHLAVPHSRHLLQALGGQVLHSLRGGLVPISLKVGTVPIWTGATQGLLRGGSVPPTLVLNPTAI